MSTSGQLSRTGRRLPQLFLLHFNLGIGGHRVNGPVMQSPWLPASSERGRSFLVSQHGISTVVMVTLTMVTVYFFRIFFTVIALESATKFKKQQLSKLKKAKQNIVIFLIPVQINKNKYLNKINICKYTVYSRNTEKHLGCF